MRRIQADMKIRNWLRDCSKEHAGADPSHSTTGEMIISPCFV
jgi:hypothetical protein